MTKYIHADLIANITISINSVTAYSKTFKSQAGAEAYAKALVASIKEEIR